MRIYRFTAALLLAGSLFSASCTTHRQLHRVERDSLMVAKVRHVVREDSLQLAQSLHYTWQDRQQAYQADILPIGPFRLSPDNGFVGEARAVRLSAVRQERRAEAAAQETVTAHSRMEVSDSASTVHSSIKETTRSTLREPIRPAQYWWLPVPIGIILFLLFYKFGEKRK